MPGTAQHGEVALAHGALQWPRTHDERLHSYSAMASAASTVSCRAPPYIGILHRQPAANPAGNVALSPASTTRSTRDQSTERMSVGYCGSSSTAEDSSGHSSSRMTSSRPRLE